MFNWLLFYSFAMLDNICGMLVALAILATSTVIVCALCALCSFGDTCKCDVTCVTEKHFAYHWWKYKKYNFFVLVFWMLAIFMPNTKQCLKIVAMKKGYDIITTDKVQEGTTNTFEKSYKLLDSYIDSKLKLLNPEPTGETK